ncbi:MAG TPA: N-methyl-D-aspartate receptor NMDAR2C subunit, partial [Thermoanaerobaculia bacterium]|nr:N-methyl-D-aspartate receptor NMDAR2C subunit [Thermoanaerobaculia bacterium]
HIDECLMHLDAARAHAARPAEIELALWFHDAIYDTHGSGNEQRSAEWAARELLSVDAPADVVERVRALILATRHDAVPSAADEQLLVDIDLSILGAPRERFAEYESQVRREYAWVPDVIFDLERGKILRAFLARPSIYATPFFRDSLESRARANLASHAAAESD